MLPVLGAFPSVGRRLHSASLSAVWTLSVLTMHVGRWRFSMRISCCRSSFSSSIWAFRSEFNDSSRSDSCVRTEGKEGGDASDRRRQRAGCTRVKKVCSDDKVCMFSHFEDNPFSPSSCSDIAPRPLCFSPAFASSCRLLHLSKRAGE